MFGEPPFRDFEQEVLGVTVGRPADVVEDHGKLRILQELDREIDRDRPGLSLALPAPQLVRRQRDDAQGQWQNQAITFRNTDESVGQDHATLGMLPAHQSLDPVEATGAEVELR